MLHVQTRLAHGQLHGGITACSLQQVLTLFGHFAICSSCFGSGSLEQDGPFGIVAMEKEKQASLVHDLGLRK